MPFKLCFLSALLCARFCQAENIISWSSLLDTARTQPSLAAACDDLVAEARKAAAEPIVRRAHSLAEVGQNRTWLDGRANALEDEIREQFALAMSDFGACSLVAQELPLLAAAYRLTGESLFKDRVIAQLEEMASWSPLQRPGWTLYTPGHRLPEDGKDGNWLATGCGIRALGDTLELLPSDALDDQLRARLNALLESEIAGVVDDWQARRPWFVRSNNPVTNQWVLPTEGLVRSCLILRARTRGVDTHRDAYDLGVKNLLAALDAHGPNGEFEEGFGYALFTVTSLLHAAHAMAAAGDRRAIDHPFLRHFPTWLVHHFQPGNMVINCFDAGGAFDAAKSTRPLLSLLAVCTNDPVARWALDNQAGGPSNDLASLAARGLAPVGPDAAPPLFAAYERATRVNWRDSWDDNATGVWVRGGHPLDQHDHQDRGHVNFIWKGKPILIEAGTPSYHHPLMMTQYTPGVGHNVVQLGDAAPADSAKAGELVWMPGWQKAGGVAPISVNRLDASGGDITVDATKCYDGLQSWKRRVTWGANQFTVSDEVQLAPETSDVILLRWHLGTSEDVIITEEAGRYTLALNGIRISIEPSASVEISQAKLPDHTLRTHTGDDDPRNVHTCIVVRSREKAGAFTCSLRAAPAE